jgi:hypothetical protein
MLRGVGGGSVGQYSYYLVITCVHGIYSYIPKQTMLLGYIVLELFCIYSLCYM